MSSYLRAISFMLSSALAVSLLGLIGKLVDTTVSLPLLIFLRFLIPGLILCGIMWLSGKFSISFTHWKISFGRTVGTVLSQYCFFLYLMHSSSVLSAILLFSTGPIFVPIIGWIAKQGCPSISIWVSIAISFAGVVFVLHPGMGFLNTYVIVGLAAGFFNALSQFVYHRGTVKYHLSPQASTLNMFVFSSVFAGILCLMSMPFMPLVSTHIDLEFTALMFIILGVVSILNQLLRGKAFSYVKKAASVSPYIYASIVFAALWDWAFYQQIPTLYTLVGSVLVIVGGSYLYLSKSFTQKRKRHEKNIIASARFNQ